MFGTGPLAGFLGGLLGAIIKGFSIVLEAINVASKAMNPGQDLDADDVRQHANPDEALLFKNYAAKLEDGDRQGINALWHKPSSEKSSTKKAWDALAEQMDNAGLYKDWDGLLRHQEQDLLRDGFKDLVRDARDGRPPQLPVPGGLGSVAPAPINPEALYRKILSELKAGINFNGADSEYQAAMCRHRKGLINKIQSVQEEVAQHKARIEKLTKIDAAITADPSLARRIQDDLRDAVGNPITHAQAIALEYAAMQDKIRDLAVSLDEDFTKLTNVKKDASEIDKLERIKNNHFEYAAAIQEAIDLYKEFAAANAFAARNKESLEGEVVADYCQKIAKANQRIVSAKRQYASDYPILNQIDLTIARNYAPDRAPNCDPNRVNEQAWLNYIGDLLPLINAQMKSIDEKIINLQDGLDVNNTPMDQLAAMKAREVRMALYNERLARAKRDSDYLAALGDHSGMGQANPLLHQHGLRTPAANPAIPALPHHRPTSP